MVAFNYALQVMTAWVSQ